MRMAETTYEVVRREVHDAIWRLRGADETRIIMEIQRLTLLAEQVRDPVNREHAFAQVAGLRARVAPPVARHPLADH